MVAIDQESPCPLPIELGRERFKLLLVSIIAAMLIATAMEVFIGVGGNTRIEILRWMVLDPVSPPGKSDISRTVFMGLIFGSYQVSGKEMWWLDLGLVVAIAGLGYAVAEAIVFWERKAKNRDDEQLRKALHIISTWLHAF